MENLINFREIIDKGICAIFNLGGLDRRTRELVGCLLTVGFEHAALSRRDVPREKRRPFHLLIDEAASFVSTSAGALDSFLSESANLVSGLP